MKIIMSRKEILDIAKQLNTTPGKNTKELQLDVHFFGINPINDKVFSKFYLNDVINKLQVDESGKGDYVLDANDFKNKLNIDFGGNNENNKR